MEFRARGGGASRHANVNGAIMPPHFRLEGAVLHRYNRDLRWPGPFGSRIPQPPAPRGRRDRAYSRKRLISRGPTRVGPFFVVFYSPLVESADVQRRATAQARDFVP